MMYYPDGYGARRVTLDEMRRRHAARMHPEFARRFFAYIEAKNGLLGVGGGFRTTQPVKPGFAPPGKSFHEAQTFRSGLSAYCAVDLVAGLEHRSPTWDECADAPAYGLHTFVTNEPWHIQPIEIRGWQTWVNAGRPDPQPFELPTGEDVMQIVYIAKPPAGAPPSAPWFVVWDGSVRYACNDDTALITDHRTLNLEQYTNLRKQVGI